MDTPVRDTTDSFLKDIDGLLRDGSSFDAKLALDRIFPPEQSECADEDLEHWIETGGYISNPHVFIHDYRDYPDLCDCYEEPLNVFQCIMEDREPNLEAVNYMIAVQGRENVLVRTGWDRMETVDQVERYFECFQSS